MDHSIILVIDDQLIGHEVLEDLFCTPRDELVQASNGAEGLQKAIEIHPDLILLNAVLPDRSGLDVCRDLRDDVRLAEAPILMVSALDDGAACQEALEAGADDFITSPLSHPEVRARIKAFIRLARYHKLYNEQTNLEQAYSRLSAAYDETIEGWSRAIDMRVTDAEGHTQRVTELAERLARALGMPEEKIVHLRRGALLHDMGKLSISEGILLKPGELSEEEWLIVKKHPQKACEILSQIEYLRPALDIPYCHHERWDGRGYPRGLKGEQIPLAARIFAVVDVWEALTSDRPYRRAWPTEKIYQYIQFQAGTYFDPQITDFFLKMMARDEVQPG